MALVNAGMPCALCGESIADPMRDTFAMTKWGIDDLRFAVLDDAACHQSCVDQWDLRDEFIGFYNRNCKNELYVDRRGHVAYRFDYAHWFFNAMALTFGILICGPPLALLEADRHTRFSRVTAFITPYAILAMVVISCTIWWSFGVALLYGAMLWGLAICVAFAIVVVWPTVLDRLR
ncbi:hypothetical protein Q31a_05210 [Aureliella helgolandensis]|uniref:Uncharacterized protein n=2 Tax=Aureliella helgolandensis TaxID=2527968 RepID=A0A518G0V3_9BACT|nr:hypothetical protein Q31a_05210 [Aureliella helgolandensis]